MNLMDVIYLTIAIVGLVAMFCRIADLLLFPHQDDIDRALDKANKEFYNRERLK